MPHKTIAPVKGCYVQLRNRFSYDYNFDPISPDIDIPNFDFDTPDFDFDFDFPGFDYSSDYNAWSARIKVGYAHQYDTVFEYDNLSVDLLGIYIKLDDADLDESSLYRAAGFTEIDGIWTKYCIYFTLLPEVTTAPRWLAYMGLSNDLLEDHDTEGTTLNGGSLYTGINNGMTYYYAHVSNVIPGPPPLDADALYGAISQTGSLTKKVSNAAEAIAYVTDGAAGSLPELKLKPEPRPKEPDISSGWSSSGGGKIPEPPKDNHWFIDPGGMVFYDSNLEGYTKEEAEKVAAAMRQAMGLP